MTLSIYLSTEIYQTLTYFGNLDGVVNKILEAGSQGAFDVMGKPSAPEKVGGRYYKVNVINQDYLSLLEIYGQKNPRISLRRLLYWFVENEVYSELNWIPDTVVVDERNDYKYEILTKLENYLFKARSSIPEYRSEFDKFREFILNVEEDIWHAK